MNIISILYMLFYMRVSSFAYNSLFKLREPSQLRRSLQEEMAKDYKYLTYTKSKKILHEKLATIDIYGDNEEETNVEHIFPQYYFKNHSKKMMMRSDLHHLYLCNCKLNGLRQNFKYVDSKDAANYENENIKVLDMKGRKVSSNEELFKKRGYLMVTHRKRKLFIPSMYSRGKIARSLSYFAIMYDYVDELENVIDIRTLLEWNLKDPVDNDEYLKNVVIYKYQGNINPFILNPDLMLYCFADKVNIDDRLLSKKRYSYIDPFHAIDYLVSDINELESQRSHDDKLIRKLYRK